MKFLNVIGLFLIVILLGSCASLVESQGVVEAELLELQEVPIDKKRKQYSFLQYRVELKIEKSSKGSGRVDLSERASFEQRKVFSIEEYFDNMANDVQGEAQDSVFIDGESLFLFRAKGADEKIRQTGVFYGKIIQKQYPFTFSMVADANTRVFSGKAKRLSYLLDIEGTPYFRDGLNSNEEETGFFIRHKGDLIGFVSLYGKKKLFYAPNLDEELERTLMYTVAFLLQFERYRKFPVYPGLIKGWK